MDGDATSTSAAWPTGPKREPRGRRGWRCESWLSCVAPRSRKAGPPGLCLIERSAPTAGPTWQPRQGVTSLSRRWVHPQPSSCPRSRTAPCRPKWPAGHRPSKRRTPCAAGCGGLQPWHLAQRGGGQLFIAQQHVDRAVGDVDADTVAAAHQADRAASRRLGRAVADGQARGAAREAAVGQQAQALPRPLD